MKINQNLQAVLDYDFGKGYLPKPTVNSISKAEIQSALSPKASFTYKNITTVNYWIKDGELNVSIDGGGVRAYRAIQSSFNLAKSILSI